MFWADIADVEDDKVVSDVKKNVVRADVVKQESSIAMKRKSWLLENLDSVKNGSNVRITDL